MFLAVFSFACQPVDDEDDGVVDAAPPCEEGLEEVCFVEGLDACLGYRTCTDGVFTACTTYEELFCDGYDDDCDGTADETFPGLGDPCEAGVGECFDRGSMICTADGTGTMCDAVAGEPAAESCNALDDDCDGSTDEDVTVDVECDTGLPGECALGATTCAAGDTVCVGLGAPVDEICDGLDNDCDGNTDEAPMGGPMTRPCYGGPAGTEGVGACVGGAETCVDGMFGACEGEVQPAADICDGLDNDCNGTADDGAECVCVPGETQPCYGGPAGTEGVGVCVGGTQTCLPDASGFGACEGAVLPGVELCDGEDDDCDGVIDDAIGIGEPCSAGIGACAVDGQRVCDLAIGQVVCDAVAGAPGAEVCNGEDDDCNGAVDDVPGAGELCTAGQGECTGVGFVRCDGDALACDAVAGAPAVEVCDGLDNDCNGTHDDVEGVFAPCSVGLGICRTEGLQVCGPDGLECAAPGPFPPAEFEDCGNGLDDDCDGATDEADCEAPCVAPEVDADCGPLAACVDQRCVPPVCDGVPAVIAGPGTYQGDSSDGPSVDAPSCATSTEGPELYFDLDLGLDTTVCVDTFGTVFDTVLSVRPTCEVLRDDLACNDDAVDLQSQIEFAVVAGETYVLAVDGYGPDDGGPFTLNVALGPCGGCDSDDDCPGRCVDRVCVAPECTVDGDCDAGALCLVGECVPIVCGDGRRMGDEQCDDGGADAGDGCAIDCTVEGGYVCDDPGDFEPDVCVQQACAVDADCPGRAVCRGGECLGVGACPADDRFEDNEAAPTVLEPGRYTDLSLCDRDYYLTRVCPDGRLTVDIYFEHDDGNLDLDFHPEGDGSYSEGDDERISLVNDVEGYPITQGWRVFAPDDAANGYAMDITVEGCEIACDGLPVIDGPTPFAGDTTGGSQVETASCSDDIVSGPERRYILVGDRAATVCIDTIGSAVNTLLSVRTDCADPDTEIACNDDIDGSRASQVELEMQVGARYVLVVDSTETGDSGRFTVNFREGPCDVCQDDDDCPTGVCVDGACAASVCGDGFRGPDEGCDDGGTDDGDGCSADCVVEEGFVCTRPQRPIDDGITVFGFTHCGPLGAPQSSTGGSGPAGSYRVFYEGGAVDANGAGQWRVAGAVQIPGAPVMRFPEFQAGSRAAVIAAATGARTPPLRLSEGQGIQMYFPDGFCGDNDGRLEFSLRAVDACTAIECVVDADCGAGAVCAANACRVVTCGDGFVDADEQCDDGGAADGDGCAADCTVEGEAVCALPTDEVFALTIDSRAHCGVPGNPQRALYTPPLPAGSYVVAYDSGSTRDDSTRRYRVGGTVVVEGQQAHAFYIDNRLFDYEAEADAAGLRSDAIQVGEGERIGVYYGDIDCSNNFGSITFTVRGVSGCAVPAPGDCAADADCPDGGLCREGVCRAIGACPADDALEPNERPDAPRLLEPGIYEGLASCDGSDDFYAARVCAGGTLVVDLWFERDDGRFALDVFPPMRVASETDDDHLELPNDSGFEAELGFWINEISLGEAGYAMRVAIEGCGGDGPEEPLCPDGSPLPDCPEGFEPVGDYACQQIRGRAAPGGGVGLNVCAAAPQPNRGIDGVRLPGGTVIEGGFFGDGADGSRFNTVGVWACNALGEVGFEPLDSDLGLTVAVQAQAPAAYVMGLSVDNFGYLELDGVRIFENLDIDTFQRAWHLVPVELEPGTHVFDVRGFNSGGPGAMGFELYGPFPLGSTADDERLAALNYAENVIASSIDRTGDTFDSGDYGFDCGVGELLLTQVTGDPLCVVTEVAERCEPVLCPDGSVQVGGECPVEPQICPDGSEAPACPDGYVAQGSDCVLEERLAAQINGFVYDVCRATFDPAAGADGVITPRGTPASGGFFGEGAADSRIAATGVYFCRPNTDETADFATPGRMGLSIPFELAVDGFYVTGVGGGFEVEALIDGNRVGFQRDQAGVWRLGQLYLTAGPHVLEVEIQTNGPGQVGAEVYGPFEVAEIISDETLLAAEFADRIVVSTIDRVGTVWDYGSNSGYTCGDGFRYDGTTDPPTCFRSERFDNCPDVPLCPEGFPVPECPEGYVETDGGGSCVYVEPARDKGLVYQICAGPDNDALIERGAKLPGGAYLLDGFFGPGPNNPLNESGIWRCAPGTNQARENPLDQPIFTEHCLYIEQTGEYVVGAAGDDGYRVIIDNDVILEDLSQNERTFREWTLQPVRLEAGAHVINLAGINFGGPGTFGAQVYGPFPDGSTANDVELQQLDYANNVVFSTSSVVGRDFTLGEFSGYECPADLRLDVCVEDAPRCVGPVVEKCGIGRGELCGNGRLEGDEQCDDGNGADGDGCSARCAVEPGFACEDVSFGFGVTDSFVNGEADPDWVLSADGLTITQNANAEPATYSTSVPLGPDYAVTFDISVQQGADDDLIGWTIGAGDTPLSAPGQPYLLFSWKQADQNSGGGFGFAPAGLRMGLVDGPITDIELWQFVDQGPLSGVQQGLDLGAEGWTDFQVYRVELIGDAERLFVFVDGRIQFAVNDPPVGNLGFYAYSQRGYTATLVSPLGLQICGPQ